MPPGPLISVQDLRMRYGAGGTAVEVLAGLGFEAAAGEFIVVLGRSGSGKSTLLNLLGAMDRPTGGRIRIGATDLTALDERARTRFRRRSLGFVFQAYNLIPTLTVRENLALPLALNRIADRGAVVRLLAELGLAGKEHCYSDEISGGEQQRVAIARALIHDPLLVLADEPTGNLDAETSQQVIALLAHLVRQTHKTLIMATHSQEPLAYADRVFRLERGVLVGA